MTKLSIIILNHNTEKLVCASIQSIVPVRQKDWEVIVVDNASNDSSVAKIKKQFPWVHIIENKKNIGFAAGNNVGIRKAKGEYLMLLNSDALFTHKGSVLSLLQYADEHQHVGIISPKVVLPNGELDVASHRGFPTPWNALTYFSGLEKVFGKIPFFAKIFGGYHQTWKVLSQPHEIDSCTGAALILRAKALDKIGLLDESFFMYGEDIDMCFRMKEASWSVVYHPGFEVLHLKNQSGIKKQVHSEQDIRIKTQTSSHFFDTMVQFYNKHYVGRYPKFVTKLVHLGVYVLKSLKGA